MLKMFLQMFAGEIYPSTFTVNELIKAATVPIVAGDIVRLGEYKVQAGEEISCGAGMLAGMDNATGRAFVALRDSTANPGAVLSGTVRLIIYSAQNRPLEIVREWRTEDLDTSATDKTKQLPFPEHDIWVREDQRLVLEFVPDVGGIGNGNVSKANSKILLAVTKKAI